MITFFIKYRGTEYKIACIDSSFVVLVDEHEFKYKLMKYSIQLYKDLGINSKQECVICYDEKIGRHLGCCDFKQFVCIDCITSMYNIGSNQCPCCRTEFMTRMLTLVEHMPKEINDAYEKKHKRLAPNKIKAILNDFDIDFEELHREYDDCNYYCDINDHNGNDTIPDYIETLKNSKTYLDNMFTKIRKKLGYRNISHIPNTIYKGILL